MFESALRELLEKHGLIDAWFSGPDVGNTVTPYQRRQARPSAAAAPAPRASQSTLRSAAAHLPSSFNLLPSPLPANVPVPISRHSQALEMQELFKRYAEELSAFDKRILALHYRSKCARAAVPADPFSQHSSVPLVCHSSGRYQR